MLTKDINVLMASGSVLPISEVKAGDMIKTLSSNKKVLSVEMKEDFFSKFILSDGNKFLVSDSQKFLTSDRTWIQVSKIQEGTLLKKPGSKTAKVIDITPIQRMEGYNLIIQDDEYFVLANGLSTK
jgi:hypothetical protein